MAAYTAVTFLQEQVAEAIRGHADLISGGDKEFRKLKEDVDQLKAILEGTASTSSSEDSSVRLINYQMLEVVHEVEDAIDSWLTELNARHRFARCLTNLIFAKKVKSLREGMVKEMLETAKIIKNDLRSLGATDEAEVQERRMVKEIRQESVVVGLEDEKHYIIRYLMKDQPELDIICIVGMPGLGKTVLAWEIFNDDRIGYEFPIRIWVNISQRFNSRYVLYQIMKHFTSNDDELYNMSSRELCDAVHACLSREKYLLVMDDIWRVEDWDDIKVALPYNNGNGKVLITSRDYHIGRYVRNITEPHKQRPLDNMESWELLQLQVFGEIGGCSEELEAIGKFIAEKCFGIPFTIVVVGGVLKDQYLSLKSDALVKEKWNEVARNENLAFEDMNRVLIDTVAFCYHSLPERLRDCFLYLGVFPAGYEIQTWTLTRLWIAEGFIQPDGKRCLEKIAEDNLNDLVSRNLLVVRRRNPMGEVKVCLVNNIIRMFCTDEAEKQNLFKEVRMSEGENAGLASEMERTRRLCLHSDLDSFFAKEQRCPSVRSFLCFRKDAIDLEPKNVSAICENFLSLRILQFKFIRFRKFPPKLIKLNHLRYIVLCVPDLDMLPEQISQLWNLQTIIIDTNSKSVTMKASLWKMIRLRHLKTKAAIILEKKFVVGDQAGDNLQTLNRLAPESVKAVSQRAKFLKTLGVCGKLATLFEDMPLGHMDHLEKLKLYEAAASENWVHRFPEFNCFPPNLKRLTLSNTFLDWKHMSTLAMIPGLEVLKLKDNAFTGIYWEASRNGFTRLQILLIVNTDLVLWEAFPDTFPCLRHLVLKNCENLKQIPDCVLQLLENLEIERVRKSVADSASNSGAKFKLTMGVACDI